VGEKKPDIPFDTDWLDTRAEKEAAENKRLLTPAGNQTPILQSTSPQPNTCRATPACL